MTGPVRLATMPNVPLAEVWRQRLHQNGIESFYKAASPFGASSVGITPLNQGLPVTLWVGEHDLDRASLEDAWCAPVVPSAGFRPEARTPRSAT